MTGEHANQYTPVATKLVNANSLTFEIDICGTGPRFALLLHGFPDSKVSWRHQLPILAKMGFTAWAPNLRGYGRTSKPLGIDHYTLDCLTADVAALIDAAGAKPTVLIGHDWGGVVAWNFAMRELRELSALAVMNMPHPACFERELRGSWRQMLKSWYVAFFQLPWLPEFLLRRNHAGAIRSAFADSLLDKTRIPENILDEYCGNALMPDALTAMINYYRAIRRTPRQALIPNDGMVRARTLLLWGEGDRFLDKATTIGTEAYVPDLTLRYLPNVSHWIQQEAPGIVNAMLAAFLAEVPVPQASALR
jgi:pimeloyl-ACP methyl ester carboxylesterase